MIPQLVKMLRGETVKVVALTIHNHVSRVVEDAEIELLLELT